MFAYLRAFVVAYASKRVSMAKRNKRTAKPKQVNIQVKLTANPETPFYYVNFMTVGHNLSDFTLSVVKVPSEYTPEQMELAKKGQPVPLEATLQLVVPPVLAKGLIRALTEQVAKYEEKFGKIKIPEVKEKNKHG
jgi:Protein of unknown function (DUF3467)